MSCSWNHTICLHPFQIGFCLLVRCIYGSSMSLHDLIFHFFLSLIIFHCMATSQFIYPYTYSKALWLLPTWQLCIHYEQSCPSFCVWTYIFNSFGYITRSNSAESYGKTMFSFVEETAKLMSKVSTPFCTPTIRNESSCCFTILTSIWYCQFSRVELFQ